MEMITKEGEAEMTYHDDGNPSSHIPNHSNGRFLFGHHYWKWKEQFAHESTSRKLCVQFLT